MGFHGACQESLQTRAHVSHDHPTNSKWVSWLRHAYCLYSCRSTYEGIQLWDAYSRSTSNAGVRKHLQEFWTGMREALAIKTRGHIKPRGNAPPIYGAKLLRKQSKYDIHHRMGGWLSWCSVVNWWKVTRKFLRKLNL